MLLATSSMSTTIISSIVLFLGVSLLLVGILLIAKKYLVPSGKAVITINDDKQVEVECLVQREDFPPLGLRRWRLLRTMPVPDTGRRR